ncbi:hypothetical protein ASPTUDRAFT_124407, partial [Aspergillus tubingensis CBS 134.48]
TAPCRDSVDDEVSSKRHKGRLCNSTLLRKTSKEERYTSEPRLSSNLSGTDTLFDRISDVIRDMIYRKSGHSPQSMLSRDFHIRSQTSRHWDDVGWTVKTPLHLQITLVQCFVVTKQAVGIDAAPGPSYLYQNAAGDDSTCGPERNVFRVGDSYTARLAQNTAQGVDPVWVTTSIVRLEGLAPRRETGGVEGGKVLIVRSDTLPPPNRLGFRPIAVAGRDHQGSTWLAGGGK